MLKLYRLENNLTQQQMADLLGIDYTSYSRIENHKRKISVELLIKFLEIRNRIGDDFVINVLKSI